MSIGGVLNSGTPCTPPRGISSISPDITTRDRAANRIHWDGVRDSLDSTMTTAEAMVRALRAVNGSFNGPGNTVRIAGRSQAAPARERLTEIL